MKQYTEEQIDSIIKLRYGSLVTDPDHTAHVSLSKLGKIFRCSGTHIRSLYMQRFKRIREKKLPLMERLRLSMNEEPRLRFGLRFLKDHHLEWITSRETLKSQIAMSLKDRCTHFSEGFPDANLNPTLLRQIYRKYGIKKLKYRWYKENQ